MRIATAAGLAAATDCGAAALFFTGADLDTDAGEGAFFGVAVGRFVGAVGFFEGADAGAFWGADVGFFFAPVAGPLPTGVASADFRAAAVVFFGRWGEEEFIVGHLSFVGSAAEVNLTAAVHRIGANIARTRSARGMSPGCECDRDLASYIELSPWCITVIRSRTNDRVGGR
ncbi:hypothetical protein [Glaciihabitans sp. UYNi722]|uniref:hypothetical protein n=1 Tax=Glaciihabitans sp. UYNi722 TaxID=3156344 RepID=UPI003392240F